MNESHHNGYVNAYIQKHKTATTKSRNQKPTAVASSSAGTRSRLSDVRQHDTQTVSHVDSTNQKFALQKDSVRQVSTKPVSANARKTSQSIHVQRKQFLSRRATKQSPGKPKLDSLPDELLLKIFSYLSPSDLLSVASVNFRWRCLANDNVIWRKIYERHASKLKGQKPVTVPTSPPHDFWKTQCITRCSKARSTRSLPMLKKIHTFTGLPCNTNKAIMKAGIKWQLCFVDTDGAEHPMMHKDVFFFDMSVCLRWYALDAPPIRSIKKIKVYAANPIFYDSNDNALPNSPCQRSLLLDQEFNWTKLSGRKPDQAEDNINVYFLPAGLLLATWKDGGEVAFMTGCFHANHFAYRCLRGNTSCPYSPPLHKPMLDDIDSKYGLHSYTCTVEFRNQRASVWSERFPNLFCRQEDLGGGFAVLRAIKPDCPSDRSSVPKRLQLPWKTDVFKGIVKDMCILDMTLLDEQCKPMWCISSAVKVTAPDNTEVTYEYDGDSFEINYTDEYGKLHFVLIWEVDQYFITCLDIHLSVGLINQWFGRRY